MKKLSINISLFFVLLTLSSCNDWLDEVKQTTTVSDEIIWQDETQVHIRWDTEPGILIFMYLHRMLSLRITVYTVSGYVQQHTNRSEKQTNFYLYKENIPNFQQTEISFGKLKYAFSVHLYISS